MARGAREFLIFFESLGKLYSTVYTVVYIQYCITAEGPPLALRKAPVAATACLTAVRPSVVLKNCLPIPLFYATGSRADYKTLEQGDIGTLEDMRHDHTLLKFKLMGWRQVDLQCTKVFDNHMKQLEYWRFEAAEATASNLRVDLGVMKEVSRGTTVLGHRVRTVVSARCLCEREWQ